MEHWHLIFTQPKKEELVSHQLEARGLEVYFPYLQFERGYHRGIRLEPFFPNYLFVRVDLNSTPANGLNSLVGLRSIVHFGSEPAVMPDAVLEMLRERLAPHSHKVMRKADWYFETGQPVVVTSGPFQGREAIFQKGLNGNQRVQVLLKLLGAWVRADLHVDQIQAQAARGY